MRRSILALVAFAVPLLPLEAAAQLAPVPEPTEYLDYVNPGTVVGTNGVGYYLGPYTAQFREFAGGPITSPQFSIYCVDVLHTAKDQWVNSSAVGPGATDSQMGNTRLGATTGAVSTYRKAAYLASLFQSWNTLGISSDIRKAYTVIHSAIWYVTQGVSKGDSWVVGQRTTLLNNHAGSMNSYSAAGWYVLSPVAPADGQEFLIRTNVVPEPSSYLLLATGLLLLVVVGRKRVPSRERGNLV